ncbi:MAG: T9SS type A sorting domain-containing protein [Crocinitomicaceae bacterium]|nr:T9SS type A sorting domain-containing protein [Crocinitomicaceae bacterium]
MQQLLLIITLLFSLPLFAHNDNPLVITQVHVFDKIGDGIVRFQFNVENNGHHDLENILIELFVNDQSVDEVRLIHYWAGTEYTREWLTVDADKVNLEEDKIQIRITEIFGERKDWGGWNNAVADKQVNTVSSEFYADAPWRMKKTDAAGNDVGIPVHFFLHDADLVPLQDIKIDNINIQLKNASDASYGPVLTYSSWTTPDFDTLFSCMSEYDAALDIKAFDLNSFSTSNTQTLDFDIDSDILDEFVAVDEKYWYFTFTIPPADLAGMNNIIDIRVTIEYANFTISDDHVELRIFRSDEDIPSQADWFRGDMHLHSMYTQNDAEIGLPLCATKEAARLAGLDWVTTTDHTSDFDNYGADIASNWTRIKDEAFLLNSIDSSMIFITGQEVATMNSADDLVHMLAYPNPFSPSTMPYLGDGNGDVTPTSVTTDGAIANLYSFGGFAYAAHPFATGDELPTIPVGGGIWNLGDNGFPTNGSNFPLTGGGIVCNDTGIDSDVLSTAANEVIKNGLTGAQVWNGRNSLVATGDENDPWDDFSQLSPTDGEFHFYRFRQGQEVVNYVNQLGLQMKNTNGSTENWKFYYGAGSDAHGSFNYSNTDDFAGLGVISTNAVGKLSTLVYSPDGKGLYGEHLLEALKNGNATLSDGPIVTMGFSTDGDDDTDEVLLGEDVLIDPNLTNQAYINIDYTTTNEFGDINEIVLIIGTESGETSYALTSINPTGSNTLNYPLNTLLDAHFGAGIAPQNEFMYVRLELSSFKDYSAQQSEYMTQSDEFHSISNPIWFSISDGAGLTSLNEAGISIFPNPATAQLTMEFPTIETRTIVVYDHTGRLVMTQAIDQSKTMLDIGHLAYGLYHVTIQSESQTLTTKFIKQ